MNFDERHISHNIREIEDLKKEFQKSQASAYADARNSIKKSDVERISEQVFREISEVLCTKSQIRENEIKLECLKKTIENSKEFLEHCLRMMRRQDTNYKEDNELTEQESRIKHTYYLVKKQLNKILDSSLWDIPKDNK